MMSNCFRVWLVLICFAFLGILKAASAQNEVVQNRSKTFSAKLSDRDFEDSKNVIVKLFYIAMRDKNTAQLQKLIDPQYIEKHGLDFGFETETIAVNNVYQIKASDDRKTLMCHLFKDGTKSGLVILNVVQRGKGLYIAPPSPPKGKKKRITPWLLHANLDVR